MTVTLSDLKTHANALSTDDDALLQSLLDAATARIGQFVTTAPTGAAPDLDLATKQLAAYWYDNREAAVMGATPHDVPESVHDLIAPYRDWCF
jgi:hypothetical protein